MRLLDRNLVAGLGLPVFRESLVEVFVQFARGIIRNVEQRDVLGQKRGRPETQRCQQDKQRTNREFVFYK